MTAPKWAVNAANRFKIGGDFNAVMPLLEIIDAEQFHKRLVALQLRAYRRGFVDGKTAEEKK